MIHFLNGKFVTEEDLVISARDLGFLRGYAVFDFLRTYKYTKPFRISEHLDRLMRSAALINLRIPWSKEQIAQWVQETLDKNPDEFDKTVKIVISGGISNTMAVSQNPTIVIIIDPIITLPKTHYTEGTKAISVKFTRANPEAKTNNYTEAIKHLQLVSHTGVLEPIYYDSKQVFEGSNSNVFAVINNKLLTPKSHILKGITRQVLLEILKLQIPVIEKDFTIQDLLDAEEVFLTSSNREIIPIVSIDDKKIGSGLVGPITKAVIIQFQDYVLSDLW